MQAVEPLEYGYTYHIYNRGINGADLFTSEADYKRFLALYDQYISPVADTYAWVLLRNHFHILLRIKERDEIPFLRPFSAKDRSSTCQDTTCQAAVAADRVEEIGKPSTLTGKIAEVGKPSTLTGSTEPCQVGADEKRKPVPSRQFSHLFNGYARYFNTKYGRHGGLFETPFKRIRVDTGKYFRRLVYYIHQNPVKHGFAEHVPDWGWSSYLTIISVKPTRLSRETVLGYFDSQANFRAYHEKDHDLRDMQNLLLEL